jgi:hypothetical protein
MQQHNQEEDCWPWGTSELASPSQDDDLAAAMAACFAGRQGDIVIQHLKSQFLERRVPPSASDAELRHVEGQRSAIAYLLRLARARG